MEANSSDFYGSIGQAFSHRCTHVEKKGTEKFEFEPWPPDNSWKVSFRREVMSGSTHPQLISDWFPEMDVAVSMGIGHSLFVFDMHQMEFETLDSIIAKRIRKIIPAESRGT